MGIYFSNYPNPCPRCGEKAVGATFISVDMSNHIGCSACGANDFTDDEQERLGKPYSVFGDGTPIVLSCDYCDEGIPVDDDGYHHIEDPEGVEGTALAPCMKHMGL